MLGSGFTILVIFVWPDFTAAIAVLFCPISTVSTGGSCCADVEEEGGEVSGVDVVDGVGMGCAVWVTGGDACFPK